MSDPNSLILDFQAVGARKSLAHRGFLLLMPMGSGKTWTALLIIKHRHHRGQVDRVLIVCQKTLKDQWAEEVLKWFPDACLLDDPRKRTEGLAFFITHYEWARDRLKILRKCGFDFMLADECHKLKSRGSKQSRRLWLIARSIRYRLGLTGTPVEGNELDFWAQVRFIDESIFGSTWGEFKDEWTRPAGFRGKKALLKRNKRRAFLDAIDDVSYIVSDEEALGLPEAMDIPVRVTLEGVQARAYNQMEQDLVIDLPNLNVAAELVVTQLIRLQQIAGGFIPDEEGNTRLLGEGKLAACCELLEGHPAPIVIYARFLPEIEALRARISKMGRKVGVITGEIKTGNPRSFDVLICQVGIVAGLDGMQHVARDAIFYSKSFSRIQYHQARSRLRRKGQKDRVRFYHILARSSIDMDLEVSLEQKGDLSEAVVNHLLKRRNIEMAKPAPKAKAASAPKNEKDEKAKKVEGFGIRYLSEQLNREPHLIRGSLRRLEIDKNEGRYNWASKAAADDVVKQLKREPAPAAPVAKAVAGTKKKAA